MFGKQNDLAKRIRKIENEGLGKTSIEDNDKESTSRPISIIILIIITMVAIIIGINLITAITK